MFLSSSFLIVVVVCLLLATVLKRLIFAIETDIDCYDACGGTTTHWRSIRPGMYIPLPLNSGSAG